MLSRLALVEQASFLDCQLPDLLSPFDDGGISPEVDIGGHDVAEALVVSPVVVMTAARTDLAFKFARQGQAREYGDAVIGLLPVNQAVAVAERFAQRLREQFVRHFNLLQAENVELLFGQQPFDTLQADTDGINIPCANSHSFLSFPPFPR